jgi:hypothetical protein
MYPRLLQDVARVLTEGDTCTLPNIARAVNVNILAKSAAMKGGAAVYSSAITATGNKRGLTLDANTVRQALMILHHHNLLIIEQPFISDIVSDAQPVVASAGTTLPQTGFLYRLNYDNILHRIHLPKLFSMVRMKFGDLGANILEAVALNGKIRKDQLADQITVQLQQAYIRNSGSSSGDLAKMAQEAAAACPAVRTEQVLDVFEQLVSNRFLVSVAPLDAKRRTAFEKDVSKPGRKTNGFPTASYSNGASTGKRGYEAVGGADQGGAKRGKGADGSSSSGVGSRRGKHAAAGFGSGGGGGGGGDGDEEGDNDGEGGGAGSSMPVELRMMLGETFGAAASAAGAAGAAALVRTNTVVRSTKDAPEEEWDSGAGTSGSGGRGLGMVAGRGRGSGRGAGRGGAGRGGAGAASAGLARQTSEGSSASSDMYGAADFDPSSSAGSGGGVGGVGAGGLVPLWTLGWEQFIRENRHASCVQVVKQLHEAAAGTVHTIPAEFVYTFRRNLRMLMLNFVVYYLLLFVFVQPRWCVLCWPSQ